MPCEVPSDVMVLYFPAAGRVAGTDAPATVGVASTDAPSARIASFESVMISASVVDGLMNIAHVASLIETSSKSSAEKLVESVFWLPSNSVGVARSNVLDANEMPIVSAVEARFIEMLPEIVTWSAINYCQRGVVED